MIIVATSDTHSKHHQVTKDLPDGDIFIHAGDLTPRGNFYEYISVGKWFESLKEKYRYRIFVAGNHDFGLYFNSGSILHAHFDSDVIYLEDEGIEIEGIKIWGSPWTLPFFNWAFMLDEKELALMWEKIPSDTDILVTHGPAYGILDQESEPIRCGSVSLLERIKALPFLKHHIFGHIHESYGSVEVGGVNFHNVAALDGSYQYSNKPIVIKI